MGVGEEGTMGVGDEKNCIELPDGQFLGWDKDDCRLYLLEITKEWRIIKEVEPDTVADAILADLMRKNLKQ